MAVFLELLRRFPRLPLALLAAMVGIGLGVETVAYGGAQWLPKLPVLALLVLAGWRRRS